MNATSVTRTGTRVLWTTDFAVCLSWPDGTVHVVTDAGETYSVTRIGAQRPAALRGLS